MSYQEQTTTNQTVAADVEERLATHDLFETIQADPSLSRFLTSLKGTQLESTLRGPNLVTVLAVNDESWKNSSDASGTIRYQVLRGAYTEAELRQSPAIKTLDGERILVSATPNELRLGGALVVRSDIGCTNGVIHVVDGFVRP